jgi:hypothetical protein
MWTYQFRALGCMVFLTALLILASMVFLLGVVWTAYEFLHLLGLLP